ncbi:uncharacterized protein LOC118437221 [Folsomia candida]|uniref:Uncharacterized protein n=1 Tax=Folsomia candida TaxID=158441 RepID=A0A226DUY3_FOLCA|nr:uncharacterized protein LOC118437221 [Folsomia candida]OXA48036.1 hypothetical protein Fcan01_16999 [Folsomia candida]
MRSTFNYWVLLWFTATLAVASTADYSKLKLPPTPVYLKEYGKLRPGKSDKYTGCMCPPTLNTAGSVYMFCGHEMSPKVGGTCHPPSVYRCVNGQAEAIMEMDCSVESVVGKRKCGTRWICDSLNIECEKHNAKACVAAQMKE